MSNRRRTRPRMGTVARLRERRSGRAFVAARARLLRGLLGRGGRLGGRGGIRLLGGGFGVRGGTALGGLSLVAVGVPTAALQLKARRGDQPLNLAPTLRAAGKRRVGHLLGVFEAPAFLALVLVDRHGNDPAKGRQSS